ncbi:MAG TPA: alpha/beta hydrolase [Mycobacteriales bacterium]|nr:alpha/beta hydrolase [Mycobacteriales bacterium]
MIAVDPRVSRHDVPGAGLRLSVLHYESAGPDLVILGGITSTATALDFIAHELSDRYNVIVPDLRGRGHSDRSTAGHHTLDDYVADLEAVIAAMSLSDPVLLGHSLGARIAARWAAERAAHGPLLLVDPPMSNKQRPYPTSWETFAAQMEQARAGTTADGVRHWFPDWPKRELAIRAQELPTCDETAVRETHEGFETDEFEVDWVRLTPPVTLLYGANSRMVTADDARRLAEMAPQAGVIAVPDAGHMVPWDNLPGFLAAVDAALMTTSRSGGDDD